MPEEALTLTTLCWGIAALSALSIALPQLWLLVRPSLGRDGLWWFRLKSVLMYGVIAVATGRNVAIWADYAWFDQRFFGTIAERWPADLAIAVFVALACLYAAGLHWKTQHEVQP